MERDSNSETVQPIWMRPAWLTAIATIITVVLSVPNVIGDYFSKQQDIEIAKTKNRGELLAQEFSIIEKTQQKDGEERVFFLNYLSRVLDDPEGKKWAAEASISLRKALDRKNELENEKKEILEQLSALALSKQEVEEKTSTDYLALANEYKQKEANLKKEIREKNEQINVIKKNNDLTIREYENKVKYVVVVNLESDKSRHLLVGRWFGFDKSAQRYESFSLACQSSICMGIIEANASRGITSSIRFKSNLGVSSSSINVFSTKVVNRYGDTSIPNLVSINCADNVDELHCALIDLAQLMDD
ncbi:hypothetical protein [Pseudoalteromonas xiamenensis]|uniref:Uncharacterized protein n=1 Tax=Pseudoalteromonas xiamenensis TaxID=882626 RepID=A0A975HKP4_9GAMM|nr:hypothetical protein [Pseudoalteromonas xiamenensis]QTH71199.1 hypothetical protein J5O05_15565 [Pseudoalteromonas xiamenensis]